MSSGANISATRYTQSNDFLKPILSAPQYKPPSVTFAYNVALTKGSTKDELFFDIYEIDTRKFDKYDILSTSPAVGPFGPNYVYDTTHQLIYNSLSIVTIVPDTYTID